MNLCRLRRLGASSLCLLLVFSAFSSLTSVTAQQRRTITRAASDARPRLVVGIVIDQFRYDYLTRFDDLFVEGGFKRLLNGGAVFTNANYIHTPTYTACGHATFMTGAPPALTGIVGNDWYDRESGARVTSVSDSKTKLVGGRQNASGMSPHRLLASTLGDELRLRSNGQAKVIGISYKDRSAILPAGKRPNGAYWYDAATGNFVTSTYYFEELPAWMKTFNQTQRADQWFGKKWEKLLPETAYQRNGTDDAPYERKENKFPYALTGGEEKPGAKFYNQFEASPFANELLAALAKAAIENEQLGADDVTDLLTVSFSANDLVGHAYGPYSHEVEDITLRTDRLLAEFFRYLDQKIGADKYVVALTADHGVVPVPEQVKALGYGGRLSPSALSEKVESALSKRFGEDKWIKQLVNGNVYFDDAALERRKVSAADAEAVAKDAILAITGVADCFTRTQILSGQLPQTMIARSVANGFHPVRNGNLVVVTQPYYFFSEGATVITTHGSPYRYDTHVPVIFYGAGITAGWFHSESSPADIAPTLAALLRVEIPSTSVGRILSEAFKK